MQLTSFNMIIRPLKEKDAKAMCECLNDDNVNHFMNIHSLSFNEQSCLKFIKESQSDKENLNYAIIDEDDNWVGTISLKHIDYKKKEAEYAIITATKVHGKGIAKLASKEILKVAFLELGLEKVYLYLSTKNERANKFYQKFGFNFDRCDKASMEINGELQDINWYYILKGEVEKYV